MQLAVKQFFNYQPASQWAFEVSFSNPMLVSRKSDNGVTYQLQSTNTFTDEDLERISQAVVSITQPKYDIEPYTNCYGNFDFVVPMYDVNNIRLTVTFEDTDDCLISYKFLTSLMGGSVGSNTPAWLNIHETVMMTITEYDTYDYDMERPNTYDAQHRNYNTTSVKSYFCKLIDYEEPNYNRNSEDPQATTVKLVFLAVPAVVTLVDNSLVVSSGVEEVPVENILQDLKNQAAKLFKNLKFTVATAAGYMLGQYDLKTIYEDMVKDLGGAPKSRADVEKWFEEHALAQSFLGQCSRGPGMLLQMYSYIESGQAAEGKSRDYVNQNAAHLFGKGNGVDQSVKNSITDITYKYNTTQALTHEGIRSELTKLENGQYVTFQYTKTDANGNILRDEKGNAITSQHIVMKGYDGQYYSDKKQVTADGIKNGTNFKITGVYSVENKIYAEDVAPVQQTQQMVATTPLSEYPIM